LAAERGPGQALDLGAGEGADAIRLAKLGYHVDAVELSAVACEKIERFARTQGVRISVRNEPLETVDLAGTCYDLAGTCYDLERYSKPHVIEKKKSARAASNASW
jgi:2-polyprenyl-3-methyl-5-hydroxy-6-metoxy-1,4-benzoquinol methylase